MASTLFQGVGQRLYDFYLDFYDPIEFQANPENLQRAIRSKRQDVLYYWFKDGPKRYTPLEYAIKIQDKESLRMLLSFVAYSTSPNLEALVFFYIDCLNEKSPPDLEILVLLLDSIPDCNVSKEDSTLTMLEYALKHMGRYRKKQWHVIDLLLKKGARIGDMYGSTPFGILRDSHAHKIQKDVMERTLKEEMRFLNHLTVYLEWEKSYHPRSDSCLSIKEFIFHTSNLSARLTALLIQLDTSSNYSNHLDTQTYPVGSTLDRLPELVKSKFSEQKRKSSNIKEEIWILKCRDFVALEKLFEYLQSKFSALVKEGDLKQCLTPWQLKTCLAVLNDNSEQFHPAKSLLGLCAEWGLTK